MSGSVPSFSARVLVIEPPEQFLLGASEDVHTRAKGELDRPPLPICNLGTAEAKEHHEELEDTDEDLDRDVYAVSSDDNDAGEEVGVVDLLEASRIVSAGRIRDLTGGKSQA
jgi:hypothetical protein